jgi:hypothetical protein
MTISLNWSLGMYCLRHKAYVLDLYAKIRVKESKVIKFFEVERWLS